MKPISECPFCLNDKCEVECASLKDYRVLCTECFAKGEWDRTAEEAIELWNTRPKEIDYYLALSLIEGYNYHKEGRQTACENMQKIARKALRGNK